MEFVDRAEIEVASGRGGDGAISFRREKYVPKGGPDGGDGGRGGSVILEVEPNLWTLRDFRYRQRYRAGDGGRGSGKKMFGADGQDCIIKVPPGTLVYDAESGQLIADLVFPEQQVTVAVGGRGGKGNVHFATATNQSPRTAERGEPGQHRRLRLELKLLADVGLIGYPNAGKSTLLARLTGARPKIADYPFTTLSPNLGVMAGDDFQQYTLADLPGLLEGAHEGRGLGLTFLRHVERTRILVYVIDAASRNPWGEYRILREELDHYKKGLADKGSLVVFNKMDLVPPSFVRSKGRDIVYLSALTGQGVDTLRRKLITILKSHG